MEPVSRRRLLRGLGTAVALPYLEAMAPKSALAATPKAPVRMAFLFVPNGVDMANWRPETAGPLTGLPSILSPLDPVKGKVSVITGLAQNNAFALGDGPGDHARSSATWLTGVHIKKTAGADIACGVSADQVAARVIGRQTLFPSLEIGCERGALAGDCDSGYSCAYSSSVSWASPSTPMAKETNPRLLFERLFGSAGPEAGISRSLRTSARKSVLDFVLEDLAGLKSELGKRDAQKIEEYLEGVRAIEERIAKAEGEGRALVLEGADAPPFGVPKDRGEHIRLMGDLMTMAFQTDRTRVCTFMLANDGSNRPYPEVGVGDGHHDVSHHGKDAAKLDKKRKIDEFHVAQLAYVLQKMDSVKEEGGSLLDNTLLVYGAGISDGDRHNHDDLPILLAGSGGGLLRQGQHYVFPQNTPMTNMFVSMLGKVGVPIEKLGDSTGPLRELF